MSVSTCLGASHPKYLDICGASTSSWKSSPGKYCTRRSRSAQCTDFRMVESELKLPLPPTRRVNLDKSLHHFHRPWLLVSLGKLPRSFFFINFLLMFQYLQETNLAHFSFWCTIPGHTSRHWPCCIHDSTFKWYTTFTPAISSRVHS